MFNGESSSSPPSTGGKFSNRRASFGTIHGAPTADEYAA